MCVLSIKVPIEKKSLETNRMHLVSSTLHEEDATQGQTLREVRVLIQIFPSSRLLAISSAALLFIHSWTENDWIHAFSKDISAK